MLKVVRSPAKVTWHLKCNGITIHCGTKQECNEMKRKFECKYGVQYEYSSYYIFKW